MMGSGENIDKVVNVGSMDDVGTRLKFLAELYELWQTGIDILDRYDRDTPFYAERRKELENATRLLYWHMTKDYNENAEKCEIDIIPRNPEAIKDEPKS